MQIWHATTKFSMYVNDATGHDNFLIELQFLSDEGLLI
jgi:hypothetical protein